MWKNIAIFRKYNVYSVTIGTHLNLMTKGILGMGSIYQNPSFVVTITSIKVNGDAHITDYTIDTTVSKIGNNVYKIGNVNNSAVEVQLKVLVYEN